MELRDRLIKAMIAIAVAAMRAVFLSRPGRCTTCWPRRWWRTCPRGHADCHLGDLAVHGAAEDPADGGLPAGLPVVLWQVWAFVAPGLYSHEKKLVLPLVVSSTVLFFIGVAFCYFFVFWPGVQASSRALRPRASRPRQTSRPT
jgi:sec-independent protein translocase protein TatC